MGYDFDLQVIFEHLPDLLKGAGMTLGLSAVVCITATVIGVLGALARTSNLRLLSWVTGAYVEIARNTPELVQLYFVFFVLPSLGLKLSPLTSGFLGMTFFAGGYFVEVFRSGIEAVPLSQIDAARALAFTGTQTVTVVILPQALRICFPALAGYFIFVLKMSALVSAIGVADLMFVATDIIAFTFRSFEIFAAIGLLYLALVWSLSAILTWVERRLQIPVTAPPRRKGGTAHASVARSR